MFHQREIKWRVLYDLDTVTTSQIACKDLYHIMRTSMQRHKRCIWTCSIQKFPRKRSLQCSIGTELAQHRSTLTGKSGSLPSLTQISDLRSWNTQERMRGYIPFKMIDLNTAAISECTCTRRHMEPNIYPPTPHRETMSRQRSYSWH